MQMIINNDDDVKRDQSNGERMLAAPGHQWYTQIRSS